jgi:hypothetical protein
MERAEPAATPGATAMQAVMRASCTPCVPSPADKVLALAVCAQGALREGWRDASDGADLHSLTWRCARKVR